jgi:hypothetical protein
MTTKLTAKEIAQRQNAARKHGIEAFQARGDVALDVEMRKRLDSLRIMAQTRDGVIEMFKERAARAMLMAEMAEDWIQHELDKGVKFDEIGLLKRVGTYQETARRALMALYAALPDYSKAMDITDFMKGGVKNEDDED